ncbi:MAG: HEAT repeat domain-containing protein [Candidatus Hermodarchaeota archaeon]
MKFHSKSKTTTRSLGDLIARIILFCLFLFFIFSSVISFIILIWKRFLNTVTARIIDKVDLYIQELSEFSESNENNRLQAIRLLEKINDHRVIDPLIRVLENDPIPLNRRTAAKALSKYNNDRVFRALITALSDEDSWVRQQIIEELKETGRKEIFDLLILSLYDESMFLRKTVCDILGESNIRVAIPHLVFLLNDNSMMVQRSAQKALIKLDSIFVDHLTNLSLINASCESCYEQNLIFFDHLEKLYCSCCRSWQKSEL